MTDPFHLPSNQALSPLSFDWELRFARTPTRLACEYWTSRCGDRPMPERADLDPVAMRRFTAHVGLIEIRETAERPVAYFIRRAGSEWEEVYGRMTGRFVHEFIPPHIEPSWRAVFDAVRTAQKPLRVATRIDFQNKTWLNCEMFVAPLGKDGQVSMLFMTFAAWTDHAGSAG